MRVLIIGQLPSENYTTGAANVVYELSRRYVDGVINYTFGTNISARRAAERSSYPNQYIGYKLLFLRIVFDWMFHPFRTARQWNHYRHVDHANPLRFAFYKVNIERAIRHVKPDIIHVNSIFNISSTRFALGCKKTPILLTCHGIFYRGDENDKVGRDRYIGNIGLANAYSGLTKESLAEYTHILGISKEFITIIPNGTNCDKFYYDEAKRKEIRSQMRVTDDTRILLTVASVQQRKGQFNFVKLLSLLHGIDYQYWIIGQGPDVPLIEQYIRSAGLEDNVKLLGYHNADELYGYYSAADIYAHVSDKEGQALCEIEARATGLRIIVNKKIAGTIPDLNSGDYFILDMENTDNILLVNWINKHQLERKSYRSLDWQIIYRQYVDLYRSLLKNASM